MIGRTLRAVIALSLPTMLVAAAAGATTPNGNAIMANSFALASHKMSVTLSGTLTGSGTTLRIIGEYTPRASEGVSSVNGVGSSVEVQPNGTSYGFVKANSVAALGQLLEIKSPNSSEVNVWYKVTSRDPRFADFFGGASTVAQTFSFSSIGWLRTASYEGTSVVNGVPVWMLVAASHLFIAKKGYNEETLYVDESTNLPYAMTGPIGTTGLIHFTKWNATTLTIPSSTTALPH
ncbi:MAG: hypothetical protein WCF25_04325 [Acidimicrobiales bacterium]